MGALEYRKMILSNKDYWAQRTPFPGPYLVEIERNSLFHGLARLRWQQSCGCSRSVYVIASVPPRGVYKIKPILYNKYLVLKLWVLSINLYSQRLERSIFREKGTRTEPENTTKVPRSKGLTFHIAASISWDTKSPLIFYHDEH